MEVPMKRWLILVPVIFGLLSPALAEDTAPTSITQTPYRSVGAFLPVYVDFGGPENLSNRDSGITQKDAILGLGFGLQSANNSGIQWQIMAGYEHMPAGEVDIQGADSIHVVKLQAGVRYFPRYPTLGLGRVPIRLTASASAGGAMFKTGDWSPVLKPTATLSAGLAVSWGDFPGGLVAEFVYRPLTTNLDFTGQSDLLKTRIGVKPSWSIRLSWLFTAGGK
jgi:hypothetical protein